MFEEQNACPACETEFTVEADSLESPSFCPFCGTELDYDADEDTDEDDD